MAEDLPEISQDPSAPLPQVDPNSQLVPYRMERTDPGQAPVVTTGYGPRARPPIQPPAGFGGGVGMPGLDQIYQAAFSKLPVDEAVKAVEAATRYIGLRGYNQALQRGEPADRALAQYGPMILKSGVGIPEALTAQMQRERMTAPPTPQQLIQNRLNQQKFEAAQAAAKAKEESATRMTPYQQAQIDLRKNPPAKPAKLATITVPLDASNPDGAKITGPADDPDVQDAVKKHQEASKSTPAPPHKGLLEKAKDFLGGSKPEPAKAKEIIRMTKDGKKAVFDADTKKFLRYAD